MSLITVTTVTTDPLVVADFTHSPHNLMSYELRDVLPPLFIIGVSIQRISGSNVVVGRIRVGKDETRPGRVAMQASADLYDAWLATSRAQGPHTLQLTYEEDGFTLVSFSVR